MIIRKNVKNVATRYHILKLKCTKFDFGWDSAPDLVEMFNCIVDTVEDSSSVRSYRKFLIANFCYKYIHKTIKLTEHYNTLKTPPVAATIRK